MKNKKIVVIGSGAFGTAISKVLYDAGNKDITIYGIVKSELEDLKHGQNSQYFKNVLLPKFKTTNNLLKAINQKDIIVIAIPSAAISNVLPKILQNIKKETLIVNLAKGFYYSKNKSLYEGISELCKDNKNIRGLVSIIGPSHAEEIIKSIPTAVVSVGFNKKLCQEIQKLFSNHYFQIYVSTDVKGAEIGATYKNVIAIFIGMINSLKFGINTTAVLLTRGINEMQVLNQHLGGKEKTIYGLTGLGDLIATATSPLSRNWTFGYNFIKNTKTNTNFNQTVEGLLALKYIYKIGKENNLKLPIAYALYAIIFEDKNFYQEFIKLWNTKL